MRIRIDAILKDPKHRPLMKQSQTLTQVLILLQRKAQEMVGAGVNDIIEVVLKEVQECVEPETLGGAIYRAVTESPKSQTGTGAEKRARDRIARAVSHDEHPEWAELSLEQLEVIKHDIEAIFVTIWLGAIDVALEEALAMPPEKILAAAALAIADSGAEGAA